jgi:protein ImuB
MTLAHARSLLGGLAVAVQPFTPEQDARSLRRLARWALRYSPLTAPDEPDGLVLDVAGCERLFGGEPRLLEQIAAALASLGLPSRLAVAPTFACAWAVARFGGRRISAVSAESIEAVLGPLPVAALRLEPADGARLAEMGVTCLGSLLQLPRGELAARFGAALPRRLDQALGRAPECIEPIHPQPPPSASWTGDGPVNRLEAVHQVVRKLLDDLTAQLAEQGRGAARIQIDFRRVGATNLSLTLSVTAPTRDAAHLWSLLRPRLERLTFGFGVEEVTLWAPRTERTSPVQIPLGSHDGGPPWHAAEPNADGRAALSRLLDPLIERLGVQAVTQAAPVATYVPERAFENVTLLSGLRNSAGHDVEHNVDSAGRPSRLLPVPEPARVIALAPDGPPAWLEWRGKGGTVLTAVGPERIALPWWTTTAPRNVAGKDSEVQDRTPRTAFPSVNHGQQADRATLFPTRDYFEVQDEHGRRLWLFCDRQRGLWFVHGMWA